MLDMERRSCELRLRGDPVRDGRLRGEATADEAPESEGRDEAAAAVAPRAGDETTTTEARDESADELSDTLLADPARKKDENEGADALTAEPTSDSESTMAFGPSAALVELVLGDCGICRRFCM